MLLRLFFLATILYLKVCGARRHRLQVGPVSLVYYKLGRPGREPWLLLHGLGSVAASWDVVLRGMRRNALLIVPELSSLGGSDIPGRGLDIRASTEVLAQLIEKETGGRPVSVAGISLGGWMAVRLALARPDLVSRLALINAGGYRDQDWDAIQSLVTVDDLAGVDRLYTAMFSETPWIWRMSREGFLAAYTSKAVKNVLASLSEEDTFDAADLARLRVPVGLIWGEEDGLFKIEAARAMAEALTDVHFYPLPGCGHAVHLEHPDRLFAALERFRREAPARSLPAETRAERASRGREGAIPADAV
jgi:pimeloyl-ACP methyl ester carboxylesterase